MSLAVATARLLLLFCGAALTPLPCLAIPAENEPPPDLRLNDPKPTTLLVCVVAADPASGNLGVGQATYPVLSERLRHHPTR